MIVTRSEFDKLIELCVKWALADEIACEAVLHKAEKELPLKLHKHFDELSHQMHETCIDLTVLDWTHEDPYNAEIEAKCIALHPDNDDDMSLAVEQLAKWLKATYPERDEETLSWLRLACDLMTGGEPYATKELP